MKAVVLACLLAVCGAVASAQECRPVEHRDRDFTVCTAQVDQHVIETRLADASGAPLGSFDALQTSTDRPILFAMNAGMYHPDRAPVGLYIEGGVQSTGLVTREGPGNFGLLPNGVFCVEADRAQVVESRTFADNPRPCISATQSGPMLVIGGQLHPRFLPDSTSRKFRNGVGVSPGSDTVYFVISDEPVTFHEMATLYRDVLGVSDALFLDGSVSRLHAPVMGRSDGGFPMGPILSVTAREAG
ncbi:phosphodiester glycosidase family protein [Jannaschia pohangensis]|uniref:Uncharacterized protein YigE, DUF2233 family n=1 Tax=Jannaschia pohangensis TaxID=390807 RepID=A0A1I3NG18_9RHOB|nr:phosphodiester glycosidase family protein [Jannaschia pohangensis]SFJ08082.1 Uncharacterized protein YigE, DUF2233 family [Jannaschia pohangensis]